MNKEKLKHFLFSIFWCTPSSIFLFFVLIEMTKMDILASAGIVLYIYFLDVKGQTEANYLSEKIEKLKNTEKQL